MHKITLLKMDKKLISNLEILGMIVIIIFKDLIKNMIIIMMI